MVFGLPYPVSKEFGDGIKLDPRMRVMALDDEDLKPLWDEIAAG